MVFCPPDWVPRLRFEPPDSVPICDFILNEKYGRSPITTSYDPYTCGLSGKTFSAQEQKQRVDHLSRGLAKNFGWQVNEGTEFDKVVCVFVLNTVCAVLKPVKSVVNLVLSHAID